MAQREGQKELWTECEDKRGRNELSVGPATEARLSHPCLGHPDPRGLRLDLCLHFGYRRVAAGGTVRVLSPAFWVWNIVLTSSQDGPHADFHKWVSDELYSHVRGYLWSLTSWGEDQGHVQ